MKKKVKWSLWALAIFAAVVFGLYSYLQPLQASLLEVNPQVIERSFTESGSLVPAVEQDLFSATGGKVLTIAVSEGEEVAAGDILIAMDTTELQLQLEQLQGQLTSIRGQESIALRESSPAQIQQQLLAIEQAEKIVETAKANFNRLEELYSAGAISRKSLEEAEMDLFEAENLLARQKLALKLLEPPPGTREQFAGLTESLQAQISLLEYQKNQHIIAAPFNGIIRNVHVKEGAVLAPGTPLLTVFEPGHYRVELFLLSSDMLQVETGMPVSVIYEGSTRSHIFDGVVYAVAPAAVETVSALGLVEQRVKVTVELQGDKEILRPGYEMDVKFITHREEDKLVIPKTSLFTENGEDALWVVRDGRAAIQLVKKGLETDESVVIEEGLHPGDLVIRNPRLDGLAEGKRIAGS